MFRVIAGLVLAAVALALCGCVSANDVANMLVNAPNRSSSGQHLRAFSKLAGPFYVKQLKVSVGPPPAELAVGVIVPRNYGFRASDKWKKNPTRLILEWRIRQSGGGRIAKNQRCQKSGTTLTGAKAARAERCMLQRSIPKLPVCRATGTVILLPGWGETRETLLGYALDFANDGYRVVLVDLRGQGKSTGKYVTYGLIERRDISQIITALYKRGLITGKLALVGASEAQRSRWTPPRAIGGSTPWRRSRRSST